MKINNNKSIRIVTAIVFTTSVFVAVAAIGVAVYASFFLNHVFGPFIAQNQLYSEVSTFEYGLCRWVLASLLLGLFASYHIVKIIVTPLMDFIEGTKQISEGNFEYKFKSSKYKEINELIMTYNAMAENLRVLYSELENKVKSRTSELEKANLEIMNTQSMMVHSEKMRSLGQLVAGITHEINNPINFIYGNMSHLKNYSNTLFQIIEMYESLEDKLPEEMQVKIKKIKEDLELEYIKEDLPKLIKSCYEGTERTKNIINDLKNFSRLDELVINDINLPQEIETTLNILCNKFAGKVEVIREYEDGIPIIEGYGGQLNQVFMNIMDNASYALKDHGCLYIRLRKSEKGVIIEFEDTGCGMKQEQLEKIFDPFYTTKPVGEGSGLGMSIGYKVIQNHNGTIFVESTEGKGTKFTIELPLKMKKNVGVENVG